MKITRLQFSGSRIIGGLSFGALIALGACRDKGGSAADSTLAKDLAMAGQQSAQPTFKDTAIAPAPAPASLSKQAPPAPVKTPTKRPVAPPKVVAQAPTPEPTPPVQAPVQAPAPAPAPAPVGPATIGAGTGIGLTGGTKVCSSQNVAGDKLVATVNSDVVGSNGAVIPAGSNVVLEVAAVQAGQDAQSAKMLLRVRSLIVNDKTYNVDGDVTLLSPLDKSKVQSGDPNDGKKKVIGGAIAGAILGQMIGHNTKGTVIGAAAGAATGAAVSQAGKNEQWQACLPQGASMRITLNSPLILQT